MDTLIRRRQLRSLDAWLQRANRKPLILRGARQVGKSTLVRTFAQERGLTLFEINLERHLELDAVFATLSLDAILTELEGHFGSSLREAARPLLFLDEVQATPRALAALRYFYEERPELPVIAAGSLLEFALAEASFSLPVGRVESLHLQPCVFEEFLGALGETQLLDLLSELTVERGLAASSHRRLLERQRQFLFVGGMPEAVAAFVATGELAEAARVQASIVETYQDDFAKYARSHELARLHRVFAHVPRAIGQKVKYANISRDDRARDVRRAIDLLIQAGLVVPIYHSDATAIPLAATRNVDIYKLTFVDIGLMNRVCRLDWRDLARLDLRGLINEGNIAEQFVAQHLHLLFADYERPELHYWVRQRKSHNAEVDFVVAQGRRVIPVEVKAGERGTLRSLHQFVVDKKVALALRIDANPPSLQRVLTTTRQQKGLVEVDYALLSLPLYAIGQLPRLLEPR